MAAAVPSAPNPLRDDRAAERTPPPCALVLFGASGDLAQRKLIPALFRLYERHLLPSSFRLVGVARSGWSAEEFRTGMGRAFRDSHPGVSEALWESFARNLDYLSGDYQDPETYRRLRRRLEACDRDHGTQGNRIFYFSTPPGVFETLLTRLKEAGLHREEGGFARVVLEKPFGRDLESARSLNRKVGEVLREPQVFRIDHYLGKETVQNLLALRFANAIFEPVWNRRYVDHVQITAAEDDGIGSRAGYYEASGVLRDMFQNHLFQLLCLVAMEPPVSLDADAVRDEKLKVLRSIRPFEGADVKARAIRGQYGRGWVAGREVPAYREEKGVKPDSLTPTYAALRVQLESWRWQGVPFLLRSGKRLPKRATEVAIQFKEPPPLLFRAAEGSLQPNVLVVRIQPDEGMTLKFAAKVPGLALEIRPVNMDFSYGTTFAQDAPDAYERLLLDCMVGDSTLFIREDETEAAWLALEPVLKDWEAGPPPEDFPNYEAGTWGPALADTLLEKPWRRWRRL